jgi:hypothetical protein
MGTWRPTAKYLHLSQRHLQTLTNPLCQRYPRLLYDLLFRASAQTMLEIASDPKHLGAKIGFLSILHTWGQNLRLHPHLHFVVPAGGFDPSEFLTQATRQDFIKGLDCCNGKSAICECAHLYRTGLGSLQATVP